MTHHLTGRRIEVNYVEPGQHVTAQGGAAKILVHGDVGEGAVLTAQGGGAQIIIDGYTHAHASITAQGGGAEVAHRGAHPTARITAQGGDAKVIDKGRGFPPPMPPPPPVSDLDGVDGVEVTKEKVKAATDVPPTAPKGTLTVQKSHRPRELWGT